MTRIMRYTYLPRYELVCPDCGSTIIYKVEDKYPDKVFGVGCSSCLKEYKVELIPNSNGVMVLELSVITTEGESGANPPSA